jgi:hypothetical protein
MSLLKWRQRGWSGTCIHDVVPHHAVHNAVPIHDRIGPHHFRRWRCMMQHEACIMHAW